MELNEEYGISKHASVLRLFESFLLALTNADKNGRIVLSRDGE
jgi:hypothetical protein